MTPRGLRNASLFTLRHTARPGPSQKCQAPPSIGMSAQRDQPHHYKIATTGFIQFRTDPKKIPCEIRFENFGTRAEVHELSSTPSTKESLPVTVPRRIPSVSVSLWRWFVRRGHNSQRWRHGDAETRQTVLLCQGRRQEEVVVHSCLGGDVVTLRCVHTVPFAASCLQGAGFNQVSSSLCQRDDR